jgi:hypothetical protein
MQVAVLDQGVAVEVFLPVLSCRQMFRGRRHSLVAGSIARRHSLVSLDLGQPWILCLLGKLKTSKKWPVSLAISLRVLAAKAAKVVQVAVCLAVLVDLRKVGAECSVSLLEDSFGNA